MGTPTPRPTGTSGPFVPINGDLDADGWLVRLWVEGQTFDYDTELIGVPGDTEIDADGYGLEAAVGYQWSDVFGDGSSQASVYIGGKYRDLDLDPNDPGSDADNEDTGVKGQLELTSEVSDAWNVSLIGSYTHNIEDYWVRLRPGYRYSDSLTIGPEFVALGGDEWDKQQVGLFSDGYEFFAGTTLGFNAGAEREASTDDYHAYLGVSLAYRF